MRSTASLAVLGLAVVAAPLAAAEPKVRSLRTQQQGEATYFELRLDLPADFWAPSYSSTRGWWTEAGRALARTPRLVPQDQAAANYENRCIVARGRET